MRHLLVAFVLGLSAATSVGSMGCVGGKSQISAEDKERLKGFILEAVPADAKRVDVNFENKIHLVGYKLEPEVAGPGATVKVTYFWRVEDPIEQGWQLFTHLQHEGYDKPENLDGAGPLREVRGRSQIMGPDRWERGKIYADEQTFQMTQDLRGPESTLYVGIYKGDARLRIISGPSDGDNRAIVAKIPTGVAAKVEEGKRGATDIPVMRAGKLAAGEKIVIDGKGADKAWGGAASTGPFVDVGTGKANTSFPVNGSAKLLWDDEHLYVLIEVKDPDVVGYFKDKDAQPNDFTATGQPMTWTRDTAEIMIDPDGDGDAVDYYEIQINPANKVFKSQFDAYNAPKTEPRGPFGHEDWDPKMKTAVVVGGTIDKDDDKDEGYTVEAQIPWRAFAKGAKTLPPKPGDTWRMNFYAMQNNGGTAWSPILGKGNFHKASRFGKVTWVTEAWLAAQASDAGGPSSDAGTAADGSRLSHDVGAFRLGDGGRDLRLRTPLRKLPPPPPQP